MEKIKYPRTRHYPKSKTIESDDKIWNESDLLSIFENKTVSITEKMDGENCTLTSDYFHMRSVNSTYDKTQKKIKNIWENIHKLIPPGFRVCGESLLIEHSIKYNELESYFQIFNIWNNNNICLSVKETKDFCEYLEIPFVRELIIDDFSQSLINIVIDENDNEKSEGFVVRDIESFHYSDFGNNVFKYVRPNHVQQNSKHWKYSGELLENKLKSGIYF